MRDRDLDDELIKNRILSQNTTFKTAFRATMGYYTAQFLATLIGLVVFGTLFSIVGFVVYKVLSK